MMTKQEEILYRQVKVAGESLLATRVSLKVTGRWLDGRLLDKDGNYLDLPHQISGGETYVIEVREE